MQRFGEMIRRTRFTPLIIRKRQRVAAENIQKLMLYDHVTRWRTYQPATGSRRLFPEEARAARGEFARRCLHAMQRQVHF